MGNPDFGFTVSDAPDNWTAMVLGVGFGPCTTPGVGIGMCDTVKIDLTAPILLFFANSAPPGSGCSATRVVKTGTLPQQAALCGLEVSSQWVVECRSGAQIGTGVTGCHQFEISAN
jgi:hypothetical protein